MTRCFYTNFQHKGAFIFMFSSAAVTVMKCAVVVEVANIDLIIGCIYWIKTCYIACYTAKGNKPT